MTIRSDWRKFSVATLLLCLLAAFAVSPPEYVRAASGKRTRAVRLDDHDQDHAIGAADLAHDLDSSFHGDDRPLNAELTTPAPGVWTPRFAGAIAPPGVLAPPGADLRSLRGRSPPSSC